MAANRSSQKTVYVLGAGCSRNYEQGELARLGIKPPLDRDFFEMAAKVLASHSELIPKFEHIIDETKLLYHIRASQTGGILEKWTEQPTSLESTLTFLDLRGLTEDGSAKEKVDLAFAELIRLIRVVFNETLKGPPCAIHSRLARLVQASDALISYNYDILADNALFLSGKVDERNYLVPFRKSFYQSSWQHPRTYVSGVKLIKLHGSLNWLSCKNCSSLLCFLGQKTPENYQSDQSIRVTCPHCHSTSEVRYVLIPPILHKPYDQPAMRHLWKTAEHELSKAERVVVIGYSMPPTDFRSELLFRSAFGDENVTVNIVNPDRQVLNRFKLICQPIEQSVTFAYYSSLELFLDEHEKSV